MRRFYREVRVECAGEGFRVLLDGRPLRTPKRQELRLPSSALAEAVAAEWRAQPEEFDPRVLHLTRLATTTLDLLPARAPDLVAELLGFARHDVLCYRGEHPRELVLREELAWDPWLDWAEREFGARLRTTRGLAAVEQEEEALAKLRAAIEALSPFALVGVHAVARLTHSLVLALAVAHGAMDAEQAFRLAHVEELWEIEQWGEEQEQQKRHAALRAELKAAAAFLAALGSPGSD